METFILYWLTGEKEIVKGETIEDAFNDAGYGTGALSALDFYSNNPEVKYIWDGETWKREFSK